MTYFYNFATPSISRKRFELETSNLACRLSIRDTNYESEKLCQKGSESCHGLLLKFCKPLSYLENGLSEKLPIWHADWSPGALTTKIKNNVNGVGKRSRDLLLAFWDPLHILRTVWARNFKFGMQIEHQGYRQRKWKKIGKRRSGGGHVTYFWHFWTTSISRGRFELDTSNLACRFISRGTNDKHENYGQRSSGSGHVTCFWNYGTIFILGTVWVNHFQFGMQIEQKVH